MKQRTVIAAAIAGALAAGCALTPPAAQQALENARAAYRSAQADPHVPGLAPTELNAAGQALNRAEGLAREGAGGDAVTHAAYLAERQAQIARHAASARASEEALAQAGVRRERAMLEARARQASEQARQAQSERDAALEQARKADAERRAQMDREAAERADINRMRAELAELKARETERGWVLGLGSDMLFDVGKATLKPGAQRTIERLARFLRDNPGREIAVEGFTDNSGGEEVNQRLSEERANAVRQALAANGVSPARVQARGYGESFPVAGNDSAAGRQLNRRVEIVIARDRQPQSATGR